MKDCSQCGKSVIKYHRIYKGEGYCHTCYVRVFKLLPCSKCGEIHRLYYKEEQAICEACRHNKPCIRCGKEGYEIGKSQRMGLSVTHAAHISGRKALRLLWCAVLKINQN